MQYRGLMTTGQVQRVYLDELPTDPERLIGVRIAKLVLASEETAVDRARGLMQQAQQDLTDAGLQLKVLELIETIIIYKLPNKALVPLDREG
jgi:predicted transposase YdaD